MGLHIFFRYESLGMQTTTLHPDIRFAPDPVSTPEKFQSGHCHLELTPVWQYIIKKNRFPTNVDRQEVFSELAVRLQHPEWQVSNDANVTK